MECLARIRDLLLDPDYLFPDASVGNLLFSNTSPTYFGDSDLNRSYNIVFRLVDSNSRDDFSVLELPKQSSDFTSSFLASLLIFKWMILSYALCVK